MNLDDLDKICAEKILGWSLITPNDSRLPLYYKDFDGEWPQVGQYQPTRNIAQAWDLAEKFDFFNLWYDKTNTLLHEAFGGKWECTVVPHRDLNDKRMYEYADTAPLAIVRACLRAKGIEF